MNFTSLIFPIFIAATAPMVDSSATAAPAVTGPVMAAPVAPATPPPTKLEFPLAGYRINAYDPAPNQPFLLVFTLPAPSNEKQPSVTVMVFSSLSGKPSAQNMVKNNQGFHQQSGDTILVERTPSPTEWQAELTTKADQAGRKGHIYERDLIANGKTYKIDATAPDAQWHELGPKLKACVDSFDPLSDPAPGKMAFPRQGFRISALDAPLGNYPQSPLMMNAVSVSIKPYAKTLKDYQAERRLNLTKKSPDGHLTATEKILAENMPTENTLVTEFAPELIQTDKPLPAEQGHGYEKAVLAHGQLYLASGIHWNRDKATSYEQIKIWVDSLEVLPIPAPAPAPAPAK